MYKGKAFRKCGLKRGGVLSWVDLQGSIKGKLSDKVVLKEGQCLVMDSFTQKVQVQGFQEKWSLKRSGLSSWVPLYFNVPTLSLHCPIGNSVSELGKSPWKFRLSELGKSPWKFSLWTGQKLVGIQSV